ncbi:glycosyltransferase family 2 protein [Clostridioides difficile]|nr:glycosyltransferase family 2 protein [Clostridioides difficile]
MIMIDIVIPNYNASCYLKNCIDSVLSQTYNDFRIIVIDNNSEDDSYEWLKEHKNILYKKLDKNYGFSVAVNEGIKLSNSEYVILLNNDTEVKKDWIENLIKTIESNENIFSASSKMIRYYEREIIDDAGDEYNLIGWTLKRGDGKSIKKFNKNKIVFSSCAGAAIYRRSILDEIGYFDEKFFAYMEDIDISYRARIYGYTNIYCSDAIVYHIGSGTTGSRYNDFKVRLSARNNVYLIYKNMPFLQILINIPFLLTGFLIKYIFFITKGYGNSYKKGFKEGIKSLDKMVKIKFCWSNLYNYIKIEFLMIINIFKYFINQIIK